MREEEFTVSEMVPFKLLTSREEALKTIVAAIKPIERTEKIPIEASSSRVLAEDVIADKDVPPFDRAAMDGYAVKAEDTYEASEHNPRTLKLRAVLHAGESTATSINNEECIRIATGCPVPPGADAVVMVEFTEETKGSVSVFKAVHPGANISPKGEDMKKGEAILNEGEFLTPAKVGVLAALGRRNVVVYQKPRVVVIPTGTEVCEVGSELGEGQVYDVNSYTLTSVLSGNGASVTRSPVVPDSFEQLKSAVTRFIGHDLIVFSGGSSVGERDLLVKVVEEAGELLFHGVQIKPGKPTLFGLVKGKPVFGMPGYPTSCLSNAYVFLVPAVRKMARLPLKAPRTVKAKMGKRIVSASGREQFLPVKLADGKAYPVFKRSGDITSMAKADGYLILPVNLDVIDEGETVTVKLYD
ncbi:MAG: molybdopterin-binding protein [Candidatus Bathyarchaeota archaeon]|nr:molybdopterin-binding protein [Candidatus Bathyarchaeota archaeon]